MLSDSHQKKVCFVFGTRPELIKIYPLYKYFLKKKTSITLINTGQHKELLQNTIEQLGVQVDFDLSILTKNSSLNFNTSEIVKKLNQLFIDNKFDFNYIVVQGDTLSAFCAAYVGFNFKISICHLEAGLRTNNFYSPFPEEMYRRLISKLSTFHFCPTSNSTNNLKKEGIFKNIFTTGNSIVDAIKLINPIINKQKQKLSLYFKKKYNIDVIKEKYILFTCHRRDNYGKKFTEICSSINYLANNFKFKIVYPLHLNPEFLEKAKENLGNNSNIKLIENQSYIHMLFLIKNSCFIISDSGGIQEEAPSFKKYVLVIRDYTERMESVKLGYSKLVKVNEKELKSEIFKTITNKKYLIKVNQNPYGNGKTSEKVFKILNQHQ